MGWIWSRFLGGCWCDSSDEKSGEIGRGGERCAGRGCEATASLEPPEEMLGGD